ncbi:MAG TPA: hypothetical protein VL551_07365 [Actinospica sp.]|jgi:hypothetical protein|nr:hypothetical protein [Actinospica sp.]
MSDIEEMKNKAQEAAQQEQGEAEQQGQSAMDKAKQKMDRTGDGKFDADDVKKMGEDAVNKVKGLFKKD